MLRLPLPGLLAPTAAALAAGVLWWCAAAPPAAAEAVEDSPPDTAALVEAVRPRVSALWGVPEGRVVVELAGPWRPRAEAAWRDVVLVGSGAGGQWVVRPADGSEGGVRVRAGVLTPVATAARTLPRGHELAAADLVVDEGVRWGPPDAGGTATVRVGWRTARAVAEGEPLVPPAVQPPAAVRAGEVVEVVWRRGGVALRTEGIAAGNAPVGLEVAVRAGGGRRLRGIAVAPGVVDVTQGRGGR